MKPKTNQLGTIDAPQGYDACQTPAYALDPLLPYLRPNWRVWEPASGEGYLADAIEQAGCAVTRGDIVSGANFFEIEPPAYDLLITNPPYSIKYQWIERCYELGRPWALLMPVETLGAARAQRLFSAYGVELTFLSRRVNFKMPQKGWAGSSAQFPVAWFSWRLTCQAVRFAELTPRASALEPRKAA